LAYVAWSPNKEMKMSPFALPRLAARPLRWPANGDLDASVDEWSTISPQRRPRQWRAMMQAAANRFAHMWPEGSRRNGPERSKVRHEMDMRAVRE
jgi:hypothetical protein